MDLTRLGRFARTHHGLVTKSAAASVGISGDAWYRAIRSDLLEPVHPGVARLPGAPSTALQRIAAAVLAVPGSVSSHRSSSRLWDVERPDDDPVDLIVPRGYTRRTLDGVVTHRPTDVRDLAFTIRSGIKTTNVLRMLCDLGEVDPGAVAGAVEAVVVRGLVTPRALRSTVERHAVRGRAGVPELRRALDRWSVGEKPADSVLELAFARLVADHGLPPVEFHPKIEGFEVDFRFVGTPVLVECDGWEFHVASRQTWERDHERDSELLAAGYHVVRFTWHHITRRAAWTADRCRTVLERVSPDAVAARPR
jgi:very-short-patch-repair endonuclease